jgi:hypothetical protein
MINKKDQPLKQKWGDPELDKAQAESDAIFAEMDGLNELVERRSDRDGTIERHPTLAIPGPLLDP